MGLSLTVGTTQEPDSQGDFELLHQALAAEGIAWREPRTPPSPADRFAAGFPYGYLAKLRRVLALHRLGEPVTPAASVTPEQYRHDLAEVDEETLMFDSHLLCHSDCEGYYIPEDFGDPLFLPPESGVPGGGMVGSSQGLLQELAHLAGPIGVRLDADGTLDATESARLAALPDDAPFAAELFTWHQLHLACRTSIAGGRAIVFG
ncbi:hypothetical protein OG455_01355 [Kitasatospora sp. NBC_01287]|uniref:hypothetical protein n=1 Tax=Kitasatospora sp. NBC_01287 TaxID=2903573 RepID=UPI00225BD144|nr:hypothetical protein [Kitasatospora sp. NBC_01287]MCX4744172.1 hypothetical protein [Kitasatospora sp. NBC_01287]